MNKKLLLRLAVGIFAVAALAGCGPDENCFTCTIRTSEEANTDFVDTPYTDAMKLGYTDEQLANKKFAFDERIYGDKGKSDCVGFVDLRSVTDGDTANFIQEDIVDTQTGFPYSLKTRFLGINTPESTAKIEPWGKKASRFVKNKLEAAQADADAETLRQGKKIHNIVLITDPSVWGVFETSGKRWLAFVWYRPTFTADFRCINLEIVEQGYSTNQVYDDSEICNYRPSFEKAAERCETCKYRVYGEEDDGFDYVKQEREHTLWYIVNNYDKVGGDIEEGTSGVRLHILAQVVGMQGDNLILRDVMRDKDQPEDTPLQVMFAFLGYNTSLCSILQKVSPDTDGIGVVVYFYANAAKMNGNIQLSGVEYHTTGVREKFRIITEDNVKTYTAYNWTDFILDSSATKVPASEITSKDELAKHVYSFMETTLEIRAVTPSDDDATESRDNSSSQSKTKYWSKANQKNTAYTIYAYVAGTKIPFNLRINEGLAPSVTPSFFDVNYDTDNFNVNDAIGKKFRVTGYVLHYFENYQITLCNNYKQYNYIEML